MIRNSPNLDLATFEELINYITSDKRLFIYFFSIMYLKSLDGKWEGSKMEVYLARRCLFTLPLKTRMLQYSVSIFRQRVQMMNENAYLPFRLCARDVNQIALLIG